jgi:hypothetical protein
MLIAVKSNIIDKKNLLCSRIKIHKQFMVVLAHLNLWLMVSYCDQSLSIVRQQFASHNISSEKEVKYAYQEFLQPEDTASSHSQEEKKEHG